MLSQIIQTRGKRCRLGCVNPASWLWLAMGASSRNLLSHNLFGCLWFMKQDLGQKDTHSWIIWRPHYFKRYLKGIKDPVNHVNFYMRSKVDYFALELTSANDRSQKVPPTERTRRTVENASKIPSVTRAESPEEDYWQWLWDLHITQESGLESFLGNGYLMYVLSGIWWWNSAQLLLIVIMLNFYCIIPYNQPVNCSFRLYKVFESRKG